MCGRFTITYPTDAMARLFAAAPDNDLPEGPRFNICPTQQILAVTAGRRLRGLRWGFLPHWYKTPTDGPLLINARAETITEKPAFRAAARERRCLVPASGFYEWQTEEGTKLPWYVTRTDGEPLVMAGIWQDWAGEGGPLTTCALVTCDANTEMAAIHHRMPVVLDPADWALWLGEEGKGAARLMRPAADGALRLHRVDRAVNSNRAEGPELIEPVET